MVARAVIAVVLGIVSSASALDKLQSTLQQPGPVTGMSPPPLAGPFSTSWIAGTSKGSVKDVGCKVQVKLSHTNLGTGDGAPGTGDEVICLGDASISYEGVTLATTAVFRGERANGTVNIKVDLAVETSGLGGCGAVDGIVIYDSRLACYEPTRLTRRASAFPSSPTRRRESWSAPLRLVRRAR
jgi:hypothetical protein